MIVNHEWVFSYVLINFNNTVELLWLNIQLKAKIQNENDLIIRVNISELYVKCMDGSPNPYQNLFGRKYI